MKYSILEFNQAEVVNYRIYDDGRELKCDLTDLLLLNYIIHAQANPEMNHVLDEDSKPYVWLQHKHLLEDLPILNITEGTLKNRLTKLRRMHLIQSTTNANESMQGSRTYYRITSFCNDLLFKNTSFESDVKTKSHHFKVTSNNKVVTDNKVNNTNSKELVEETSTNNNSQFLGSVRKSVKENLYSKCQHMIDDFTDDTQIRMDLQDYLQLLLEMRKDGLNFYANNWKGLLRKLKELSTNKDTQHKIICQSIEKGYKSFFPVNDYTKPNKRKIFGENDRISCEQYTEQELEELRKLNEERERQGLRTKF